MTFGLALRKFRLIESFINKLILTMKLLLFSFSIHSSLWESLVLIFNRLSELRETRRFLFKEPLPPVQPKYYFDLLKKAPLGNGWCLPLVDPLPDESVINRTQRYFHEKHNKRPTQVQIYLQLT